MKRAGPQAIYETKDFDKETALLAAVKEGDIDRVKYLIELGAKVDAKDEHGVCALIHAFNHGHLSILEALMSAGANIESLSDQMKYKILSASLEILIEDRKALEAEWRDKGERIIEPTTPSFPDIHGRNLLDYAIILEDKDRINYLIAQGVTSNIAIGLAINFGREDIIDYLAKKGCSIKLMELYQYVWNKELLQKYVKRKIQELIQSGKYKQENLWHYYAFLNVEDLTDELLKLAGDLNKIDDSKLTPLQYAALLKNVDMVNLMLSKGADPNLSDSKINLPIYIALRAGNFNIVSALFKQGAKHIDTLAINLLFLAVRSKNWDCVNFALSQNPDHQFCDYLGRTILHEIAMIDDVNIIKLLISRFDCKPLLALKDLQGDDPLQLAINHDNTKFIDCLKEKFGKEFIEKLISRREKKDRVLIKQTIINSKLKYFLRLFNYDPNMIDEKGTCCGLGFLILYYTDRQKRPEFFQCLSTISGWNGTINMAQGKLSNLTLSGNYTYLKDLLRQWANDIIWFQQASIDSELKNINPSQDNRMVQYDFLKKDNAPFLLNPFIKQAINVNIDELNDYVTILSCLPNIKVEFGGGLHLTSLYVHGKNKLDYYDPNQNYEMPYFTDPKSLTRFIAGLKYAALDFKTTFMPLRIYAYQNQAAQQNDNFNYFSEDQLPKNQSDLNAYQSSSANNFTQLHVAVLTNSLSNVIDILKNKELDLTSKDTHGFSALELALALHRFDMVKHMIQSNRFIDQKEINTLFTIACWVRNFDLISILTVPEAILHSEFFRSLKKSDDEMVKTLLLKGVDANKKDPESLFDYDQTPLRVALLNKDDKIAKMLIKHGVKISIAEMGRISRNEELVNEVLIHFKDKLPIMRPSKYAIGQYSPSFFEEFLYSFNVDASESQLKLLDYFADHPSTTLNPNIFSDITLMKNIRNYYRLRRNCNDWLEKCIKMGAKIENDTLMRALSKFNECGDDFAEDYVLSLIKLAPRFSRFSPIKYHDGKPDTLLHSAIQNTNSTAIVRALIEKGAEVNCPRYVFDFGNYTPYPLHLAIKLGKPDMVKLLLEKGADPSTRFNGKTATEMAQEKPTIQCIFDEFEKEKAHEYSSSNLRKLN